VFTDIQLPGADGHELALELRELERRLGIERRPVVALTANALRGERERCIEAGMDDLVVKPATLATLAAALRRWLPDCVWRASGAARESSTLEELTGGDVELGRAIVERYLCSLDEELVALGEAQAEGDLDRVRRHAHRIAGASRTVGARSVAATATLLEAAAGATLDIAGLEPLAEALRVAAARPADEIAGCYAAITPAPPPNY
jgi:HPt (histidine-containing phosphotransfer) domain-containing protein